MPDATDRNPAEQIRAKYVETIAQVFYEAEAADELATTGERLPSWDRLDRSDAHRAIADARLAVDALAAAGLLPTQRQQMPGNGHWRYVTAWREPNGELWTPFDSAGQVKPLPEVAD
jgi:hypothetical protein